MGDTYDQISAAGRPERYSGSAPIRRRVRASFCGRYCRGNFKGDCDSRIGETPVKIGISRVNSMVSGPTNSRCSWTIGNDRGATAFELSSVALNPTMLGL